MVNFVGYLEAFDIEIYGISSITGFFFFSQYTLRSKIAKISLLAPLRI
jgi:hypothetical protein